MEQPWSYHQKELFFQIQQVGMLEVLLRVVGLSMILYIHVVCKGWWRMGHRRILVLVISYFQEC